MVTFLDRWLAKKRTTKEDSIGSGVLYLFTHALTMQYSTERSNMPGLMHRVAGDVDAAAAYLKDPCITQPGQWRCPTLHCVCLKSTEMHVDRGRMVVVLEGWPKRWLVFLAFHMLSEKLAEGTNLTVQHQVCRTRRVDHANHTIRSGSYQKRKMAGLESSTQHLLDTVASP